MANKSGIHTIYCQDGPFQGRTVSAVIRKRKILLPMANNPFYKTAIYMVTADGIGVFSHCQKRIKDASS